MFTMTQSFREQLIQDDSLLIDGIEKKLNLFYLDCGERVFFNILKNIKLHKTRNYVVITGRGQPTVATRSVVHKLSEV